MSLFEQFPYTNFHELNLDWLIQEVKNYGASVVLSVNGQTGDVVLYQDPNVRFPDVDNSNWSIVRTAAGHELGIQFQNGMAYLRFDGSTERIYTTANPPAYPVTSVDGQTGAVQVFPNADTVLPAVDNTRTIMRRQIKDANNQDIFTGVQAEADALKRLSGTNLYTIYDQGNPPPYPVTSVNGSTGAVILAIPFYDVSGQEWTANDASPTNIWEMSRYTLNGALATLRLTTANGLTEGYLEFYDEGTQTTVTKKILTTDDIPSSAGVVSLNGQTGVVNLYGSNIDLYSGSQDTVKDAIDYTRSSVAYREDGATASQNIPNGSYVIWQGEPYISTAAISSGDTLSGSNLTAKPAGIGNALRNDINTLSAQLTKTDISSKFSFESGYNGSIEAYECAGVVHLLVTISTMPTLSANTHYDVISVNDAIARPKSNSFAEAHRASNYSDYGTTMLAAFPSTPGLNIRIGTGSSVGSGNIRFSMVYINSL